MPIPSTMADLSTVESLNSPAGPNAIGSDLDNYLRAIQKIVRTTNAKGADIAAAATTNIASATAEFVDVTGTATITSLGSADAGIARVVRFTSTPTLVNSASIILPGTSNHTCSAGDVLSFRSLGSGAWLCTNIRNRPIFSGEFPVADSVAGARLLTGLVDKEKVETLGYYSPGDGGNSEYWHDASDTTSADNGGSVLVTADGKRLKLVYNGMVDFRQFGAKNDGVTDSSAAVQAIIDAGLKAACRDGSYLVKNVDIDSSFTLVMGGGTITSGSIDVDVFNVSEDVNIFGYGQITLCRSFLSIAEAAPTDLSIVVRASHIYISNAHDFIVGNKTTATAALQLIISGLRMQDMEIGVFTRDIGWSYIMISDCRGFDFKLKSLTSRPAGNKFNLYYVSGILIDAQGYSGSATATGCIFKQIYNSMVDPVTLAVVTPGNVENHGIAIETDGSVTIADNNVEDVSANLDPQDVEGIIARGREISVTGNTLYDAGDDEGCIYTKGSTYGSVTGNTVVFSSAAADTNEKFGLVVSSKEIAVSGNTFVNCGRGINLRVGVKLGWNTYVNCVAAVFNGVASTSEMLSVTGSFKGNTIVISNQATAACTVVQVVNAEIELPVGGKIMSTISASTLVQDYIVRGCTVLGTNAQTVNELILFQSTSTENLEVSNNAFRNVKKSSGTLSVIRISNDPNNVYIKNNTFDGADECIRLRDRTYANLITTDNSGFDLTGSLVNSTAITVSGTNVIARNNA